MKKNKISYCSRCCLPETVEGISFDELGVCMACKSSEEKMHIDWKKRGYKRRRLEYLCNKHGFYYHSHRALDYVNALIFLLTHQKYNPDKPIKEIIQKIQ